MDLYDHHRGGHFGYWLVWFATEFSARFDAVVVITPTPSATRRLFAEKVPKLPRHIFFAKLHRLGGKCLDLQSLANNSRAHIPVSHFFFMWGYDLAGIDFVNADRMPWATLFGFSWLYRSKNFDAKKREHELLQLVESDNTCKGFFQPDFYLRNNHNKAVWITDIENIELVHQETELARRIRDFRQDKLCVGAFGMLTGNRCVNEMVLLARDQPEIRFILAGRLMSNTFRQDLAEDLLGDNLKNLMVLPGFIKSDEELNAAISAVDVIFIDSRNYPVQSGIVTKGMHFGKWVLSSPGNSWTNDLIEQEGVGYIYSDRSTDIIAAWMDWKERNGEAISRGYSEKVRDPAMVAACFDELTRRLNSK